LVNLFRTVDKYIVKLVSAGVTIAMIAILGITFIQVAVRFVFHVPIGGWDEMPMYMMLIGTWLTAAVNVKKKDHITLDLYVLFIKGEKGQRIVRIIISILTVITYVIFSYLLAEFMHYNFIKKATTAGLSIPYWIILAIMLFSVLLMIIYYAIELVGEIRGGKTA